MLKLTTVKPDGRVWTNPRAVHRLTRCPQRWMRVRPRIRHDDYTSDRIRIARRLLRPAGTSRRPAGRARRSLATCASDTCYRVGHGGPAYMAYGCPDRLDERIHVAIGHRPGSPDVDDPQPAAGGRRASVPAPRRGRRAGSTGVPVTSFARTWRDLAMVLDLADLVAAGDSALRSGAAPRRTGRRARGRRPERTESRRARGALPLLDQRSRSRPESHLRVAISGPDMPRFEVNEAIYRARAAGSPSRTCRSTEARIALEYQGEDHAATVADAPRHHPVLDMRRDEWLCCRTGRPRCSVGRG